MLFEIEPTARKAAPVPVAALTDLGYRERHDLQEWVISNPAILGEELLIITDEYSRFDRTRERLDLLALDRQGKLVVVELKRSAVGTHADLQAIRYAAYCSTFRLQDVGEIYSEYRSRRGDPIDQNGARQALLDFVGNPEFIELDNKPRIILCAEDFPPEITASTMWLRTCDIDIRLVRVRPYKMGIHLVLDATVLIPLPEAEEFVIRRERKEAELVHQGRESQASPETQLFLAEVIRRLQDQPGFAARTVPKGSIVYYQNIGRRSYLATGRTNKNVRVELYIDEGDRNFNRAVLETLAKQSAELEEETGGQLLWLGESASRKCAVMAVRDHNPSENIEEVAVWAADKLLRFRDAFGPKFDAAISAAELKSIVDEPQ